VRCSCSPFLKDLRNLDYFREVQGFQTIIAAQGEKIRVVNPNPGVVLNLRSSRSALESSLFILQSPYMSSNQSNQSKHELELDRGIPWRRVQHNSQVLRHFSLRYLPYSLQILIQKPSALAPGSTNTLTNTGSSDAARSSPTQQRHHTRSPIPDSNQHTHISHSITPNLEDYGSDIKIISSNKRPNSDSNNAGPSNKRRQLKTTQHNSSSTKSMLEQYPWKNLRCTDFPWLRYDHVTGIASCSHLDCNKYSQFL